AISQAGGIYNNEASSRVTLVNDIVWNNIANSYNDMVTGGNFAPLTTSFSLFGNVNTSTTTTVGPGNLFDVLATPALLGSLGDNGGPTLTMMPVAGSLPVAAGGNVTTTNAAVSTANATTVSVASGAM